MIAIITNRVDVVLVDSGVTTSLHPQRVGNRALFFGFATAERPMATTLMGLSGRRTTSSGVQDVISYIVDGCGRVFLIMRKGFCSGWIPCLTQQSSDGRQPSTSF